MPFNRSTKRRPKPKASRPALRADNPEQWGQYYFRNAILDQNDTYFMYLNRAMKRADRDTYLISTLKPGIQIMPQCATQSFDYWRHDKGEEELSAWWKSNRPGFGAVSYGIDPASLEEETVVVADLSPRQWTQLKQGPTKADELSAGPHGGHLGGSGSHAAGRQEIQNEHVRRCRSSCTSPNGSACRPMSRRSLTAMSCNDGLLGQGLGSPVAAYHKRHKGGRLRRTIYGTDVDRRYTARSGCCAR